MGRADARGMTNQPQIIERPATPYVAITTFATMRDIGTVVPAVERRGAGLADRSWPRSVGAPLWKYNLTHMDRGMEIAAGTATADLVEGDERVRAGVLPAGQYAVVRHVGHPRTLIDATARLLSWADEQGLNWDVTSTDDGERWGCRLETYYDEPGQDMNEWETELAFRLAG